MKYNPLVPETYKVLKTSTPGINTEYSITFRITDSCNLKCDYCHWNSGVNYKLNDIIETISRIMKFIKNEFSSCTFYYHGGEPTYHPKILEIIKYVNSFKEDNFQIIQEVQTNLTQSSQVLQNIINEVDFINVSSHWHELKDKNMLDRFKSNINLIPQNKRLSLDIMQEPFDCTDDQKLFYDFTLELLKKNFLNSEMINGFCHYSENNRTLEQHIDFYNKWNQTEQTYEIKEKDKEPKIYTTNDLFRRGLDCTGMICEAGKNTIVINGDGNMFVCGIAMTNYTKRCTGDKPYLNIIQDNNYIIKWRILVEGGYKCKWNYCGGDFYLGKK